MKCRSLKPLLTAFAFALLAGCSGQESLDPNAPTLDPKRLVPAQGRLTPGLVVYDDDGVKLGRVVKVDPDYQFSSGTRGGVLMDWAEQGKEDSYTAFFTFDNALIIPPSGNEKVNG